MPCPAHLLQLLLGPELGGAAARLLTAVGSPRMDTRITLPANDLVLVGLLSQELERRLDDASPKAEHQVERALPLDVVVRERASVLELLSRENETLLIRRNAFLVLDLRLDVLDGVRRLDLEGDGLTREGLDENLHGASLAH